MTDQEYVNETDPITPGETTADSSETTGAGRQGRIQSDSGGARRVAAVVGLVCLLTAAIGLARLFWSEDPEARADARRRVLSALELDGVGLEPVRPGQVGAAVPSAPGGDLGQKPGGTADDRAEAVGRSAMEVTLSDEHLDGGRVKPDLLAMISEIGPRYLTLAQTQIDADGIRPIVSETDVRGLSLLGTGVDDMALSGLANQGHLRLLSLERTAVSDRGLGHIDGLSGLRQLYLTGTRITDDGLVVLGGLTRLESVKLGATEIGDAGLVVLARLPRLKYLALDRTRVTDAGVPVLEVIDSLRFLDLQETWITADGVKRLKRALPECRIVH